MIFFLTPRPSEKCFLYRPHILLVDLDEDSVVLIITSCFKWIQ